MNTLRLLACVLVFFCVPVLRAAEAADEVRAATAAWVAAFNSRDPARTVAQYAPDAVFWGTTSQTLRTTPAAVAEYFSNMPATPQTRVAIGEQQVQVMGEVAINSGTYTFTGVRDGQPTRTPARFTFVFRKRDGRWQIVSHHSSAVPAPRN